MGDERARSGREQRFAELFDSTVSRVAAFVRRRVPSSEVDDVVADVFLTAWRHFDKLESMREDVVPWLYRVALNATLHSRRSSSRRQRLHDRIRTVRGSQAGQPDEVFAWSDGFTQAFDSLGERDREVLRLAIWEGLDSSAAAAVLGCTPGAFQVRAHRARERLRRRLERSGVDMLDTSARHQTDPQADRHSPPLTLREDNP